MHIREVDEHLDYHQYWHFPPEVHDITVAAGHRFWQDAEGMADHYPCPPCKPGAQAFTHGAHDVINLFLGKPVRTPQHYERLHDMVVGSWDIYKRRKDVHLSNLSPKWRHVTVG